MPNHAAFTRDGVEDARRGHPSVDLSAYAQSRGLEVVGQALIGHVAGLNPLWQDYVFNATRGEVVPGRFGTLQHELYEIGLGDDAEPSMPGRFHGLRAKTRMTWRSFVPLGELFEKEPPNEPFAAQSVWVPTTAVKVMVPEAALLPKIVIVSKDHGYLLDPELVDGYRLSRSRWIGDDLQAALAAALGRVLACLRTATAFVRVTLVHGSVGLHVDGFRDDPEELDALRANAAAIADALAEIAAVTHDHPAPEFAAALPPFDRATQPQWFRSFENDMDRSGLEALNRDAGPLGMRVEDPAALHRAFPTLPVPGTSMGVLAGTLPGTDTFGRLTWQTQSHPSNASWMKRGAIIAAPADAPELPIGGTLLPSTDMYVATGAGAACCWTRENTVGKLDTAELAERAAASFAEAGLLSA